MDQISTRKPDMSRPVRRDEYRGNPLLVLPMSEDREFSFGLGKARTILAFILEIQKFVDEHTEVAEKKAAGDPANVG